jgi:hypothetical protein
MTKIFFVFMLFGQISFAQTSFYIAPLIIRKAYFCSYPNDQRFGAIYSQQTNINVENPYFSFNAQKFSFRPELDIGIQAEVSFDNKKHRLGLEWASDATGTMSKTTFFASNNTIGYTGPALEYTTYGNGTGFFQTGFTYNRISLRYQRRLTKEKTAISVYVIPELSFIFGKENRQSWVYENDTLANNSIFFHNDARRLSTEISAYYFGKKAILPGIGIRVDFNTMKKNKYLFSIDLSYKQGIISLAGSDHTQIILDSGKTFAITNSLVARGSGLYFQISRSFRLYTLKKRKVNES